MQCACMHLTGNWLNVIFEKNQETALLCSQLHGFTSLEKIIKLISKTKQFKFEIG